MNFLHSYSIWSESNPQALINQYMGVSPLLLMYEFVLIIHPFKLLQGPVYPIPPILFH